MKLWALGRSSQLSWGTKCWMRFYRCSTLANRGSKISNITSFFSAKFQTIRNSVHKTLSWSHSEVLRDAEKKPKQNRNAEPVTNFVTKSRVPPLRRDYSKYFKMLAQAALTLAASWLSLGQVVLQQHGSDENCPPCYGSNSEKSRRLQPTRLCIWRRSSSEEKLNRTTKASKSSSWKRAINTTAPLPL